MDLFTVFFGTLFKYFFKAPLENCPILKQECHSFEERLSWFNYFSFEEKRHIKQRHIGCLNRRDIKTIHIKRKP
ncbi:hypothetical protein SAMN05444274_101577 [Mariniphaga anaerophila]|uniref:Uncharacterized protein n=1 Tax=Mariniphaga anaerophila TaxID=1484053 RepID=A0A1M4U5P6_9BACT|nr:hypothetical protein SAMN05444274_101577 [Mariniphaga anaerophila]